jgi:hypothetical protein
MHSYIDVAVSAPAATFTGTVNWVVASNSHLLNPIYDWCTLSSTLWLTVGIHGLNCARTGFQKGEIGCYRLLTGFING